MNFNGTTTYRKRKLAIVWTGQRAEHVATNHAEDPDRRPLHIETQKALQSAVNVHLAGSSYLGLKEFSSYTIQIPWEMKRNFALIKTAQKFATTPTNLLKAKGLAATKNKARKLTVEDLPEDYKQFAQEQGISLERYVKMLNEYLDKKGRK